MRERLDSIAELLAIVGIGLVLVLVPLVPGREYLDVADLRLPIDSLVLAVPVALLLSVPLFRRIGALRLPHIGVEGPALVFLAVALVGVPLTGAGPAGIGTWLRYAGSVALIPAVGALARSRGNRRLLLWVLVAGGAGSVLIGVLQYLNPTTIQLIGMQGLDQSVAGRIYSTYANPNFYSEYLVLLIGATLSLAFLEKGFLRGLAFALLACEGFALLATYTRGSWLALAVGLLVAAVMIGRKYIWGLVGAAAVAAVAVPGVGQRIVSIFSMEGTASFRLRLWRLAGTIIQQHLLLGVGIGRFISAFKLVSLEHPELGTGYLVYGAHNSYFTLTAETGILGGLAFVWLVASVMKMGVFYGERMGTDVSTKLQNAALTVGLVAFAFNALTSNSFQHPQAAIFFWVLAGLQAGLGDEFWKRSARPAASREQARTGGILGGSVVLRMSRSFAGFVRGAWEYSDVHRWLVSVGPGDGTLLRTSRIVRLLLPARHRERERELAESA